MAVAAHVSGRRIREARLAAGLTQSQLARSVNTSERNIVRWETEANVPRLKHLAAIAEATGCEVSHFLADTDGDDDEAEAASMKPLVADTMLDTLAEALDALRDKRAVLAEMLEVEVDPA